MQFSRDASGSTSSWRTGCALGRTSWLSGRGGGVFMALGKMQNENTFLSGFTDASDGSFEYIIQRSTDRLSTCWRTFISGVLRLRPRPFLRLPDPSVPLLPLSHVFLRSPGGGHLPALRRFGLRPLLPVSRQQAVHAGEPLQ